MRYENTPTLTTAANWLSSNPRLFVQIEVFDASVNVAAACSFDTCRREVATDDIFDAERLECRPDSAGAAARVEYLTWLFLETFGDHGRDPLGSVITPAGYVGVVVVRGPRVVVRGDVCRGCV